MSDVAYHMVHYREFSHDKDGVSKSMEDLVRTKLSSIGPSGTPRWEAIQDRLHELKSMQGLEIVINRVADLSSAVFGEMCLIHRDGLQALLNLTAEKKKLSQLTMAEIYSLTESGAPDGTRYVRGLSYFLIMGSHFFFIRTQSLNPNHIKEYFEWLLTNSSEDLGPDGTISMESKFDRSVVGENIGEVKALRVTGPSFPQMSITPADEEERKQRAVTRKVADGFVQFGEAFEIIKNLLGPAKAESLAKSLGPKKRLVVDATVKVRGTRTEASRDRMRNLASELDSMTEGKITVEGKDGRITDRDVVLRTKMPFAIEKDGSHLFDFDNVADQLQTVYKRFVEDGLIKS